MSMKKVLKAFKNQSSLTVGNLQSTGTRLFSYALCIAEWKNGELIVYNYTASGRFRSVTTSKHVGMVSNFFPDSVLTEVSE